MSKIINIGKFTITINDDHSLYFLSQGANIDSDGSPHSYHPDNTGLDFNQNAKDSEGHWVGVLTDNNGNPLIQGPNDPAPGYYISTTSYQNKQYDINNPLRYLDAETVPYFVVNTAICRAVDPMVLGCRIILTFNGVSIEAMAGDLGPRAPQKFEISIAAAKALGIPSSPKNGGTDKQIEVLIFPGSPAIINGIQYDLQPL